MIITYNGFSSLDNVQIDNWTTEAVLAEDGLTVESIRNVMEGTGTLYGANDAALNTLITNAKKLLTVVGGNLTVAVEGSPNTTVVNVEGGDDFGGPHFRYKITRMYGLRTALVSFTIEWNDFETSGTQNQDGFVSHRWVQQFSVDVNGTVTQTVNGVLRVRRNAANSLPGIPNRGNNPDAWRLACLPKLPNGFRTESFSYVESEDGTGLIYSVVNKQHHRDIPYPAFSGDGTILFRRSLDDSGGMIGQKVYDVTLEGNRNSSPAQLLAGAIAVAKNFISFTGPNPDLITSMEISQEGIFSQNRIRCMITAKAVGGAIGNTIQPLNFSFSKNLMENVPGYQPQSPYGSAAIMAVRRTLTTPTTPTASIPVAETTEAPPFPMQAYTATQPVFDELDANIIPQGTNSVDRASNQHALYPILSFMSTIRFLNDDTGMRNLKAMSQETNDIGYQVSKPTVFVEEEVAVSRYGYPPERYIFGQIPGSIVRAQRSTPSVANTDANQTPIFQATHFRRSEIVDHGQQGWHTQSSAAGTYRVFWPNHPAPFISGPYDPRITDTTWGVSTPFDFGIFGNYPLDQADKYANPAP